MRVEHGEVSEWFKELVLKTSDAKAPRVRISASPPLFYFNTFEGCMAHSTAATALHGEVLKRPKRRPC